jgi:hypothetical protein
MSDPVLNAKLTQAIGAHGAWKSRLRLAAHTQADPATIAAAGDHHACEFGCWLDSLPVSVQAGEEAREAIARHAEFHRVAGRAAQLIAQGKKDAALGLLDTDFNDASRVLTSAVSRWKLAASR